MGFDISQLYGMQDEDYPAMPVPYRADYDPASAPQPKPIDPVVLASLAKKYPKAPIPQAPVESSDDSPPVDLPPVAQPSAYDIFAKKYGDDARKKIMADAEEQKSGLGWAQFAAGIGDALAHRSPDQTAKNFDNIRKGIDDRTVGAFDNQKAQAVSDLATKKTMEGSDPNSDKSKVVQQTIKKLWGDKFTDDEISKITADEADLVYKPMELKAKLEEQHNATAARLENSRALREDRADKRADSLKLKLITQLESAKGNPAAAQAEKDLYAVKKVDSMVDLYGDPNKLNPSQVQLLASEVAKIASGGVPTHSELQGLKPSTISSGLASLAEKVTNSPTKANAGAFVKAMQDYTTSVKKDAQAVISEKYGRVIEANKRDLGENGYADLKKNYLDRFASSPSAKPKTIIQNGHTYNLNEVTGEYE